MVHHFSWSTKEGALFLKTFLRLHNVVEWRAFLRPFYPTVQVPLSSIETTQFWADLILVKSPNSRRPFWKILPILKKHFNFSLRRKMMSNWLQALNYNTSDSAFQFVFLMIASVSRGFFSKKKWDHVSHGFIAPYWLIRIYLSS